MKKGDDFWDDIDSLLDERTQADHAAMALNKSLDRHDRAIAQHITEELDRTSLYTESRGAADNAGLTVVSDSLVNNSRSSNGTPDIRSITGKLMAWVYGGTGSSAALRPALVFAVACVLILPVYLMFSTQTSDSSRMLAPLPSAAASFAGAAVSTIDYSKGSYGLLKSQPSEVYKAFITGVLYTDRQFYQLAGQQIPNALYLTFADKLGSRNSAMAEQRVEESEQRFEQAVQGYSAAYHGSEHADLSSSGGEQSGNVSTEPEQNQARYTAQWFQVGGAVEYVRVTATIAMEDYQGNQLIEALNHFARATSGLALHGQSSQFMQRYQQLAEKAGLSVLSPDDIEAVQEHAASLKILVR